MNDNGNQNKQNKRINGISRRNILQQSGLLAGGITAVGKVTGASTNDDFVTEIEHREERVGNPGENDKWNAIHINAIALPGFKNLSQSYSDELFDAISTGLQQLHDELGSWFAGYSIRCFKFDKSLNCDDGERLDHMAELLDEAEKEAGINIDNRLNHFGIGCVKNPTNAPQSPRSGGIAWGDHTDEENPLRSSIGVANANLGNWSGINLRNMLKVRSFHQALHMFIDGDIAIRVSGLKGDDVDDTGHAYDAQHTLGTVGTDDRRTIMADLGLINEAEAIFDKDGYESEAKEGRCGSDAINTRWPDIDNLEFSECTKQALRLSAIKNANDTIVDNRGGTFDRTLWVDVSVVDGSGDPASGETVKLTDRRSQERTAQTNDAGRVTFQEGVGPSPKNPINISLPEHGVSNDLGYHNGGKIISETLTIPNNKIPVVDNSGNSADQTVTVNITVEDSNGNPISDTEVFLFNSGTYRSGYTGQAGRIQFLEGVGSQSSDCNSFYVMAWKDSHHEWELLNCYNGGESVTKTLEP